MWIQFPPLSVYYKPSNLAANWYPKLTCHTLFYDFPSAVLEKLPNSHHLQPVISSFCSSPKNCGKGHANIKGFTVMITFFVTKIKTHNHGFQALD